MSDKSWKCKLIRSIENVHGFHLKRITSQPPTLSCPNYSYIASVINRPTNLAYYSTFTT